MCICIYLYEYIFHDKYVQYCDSLNPSKLFIEAEKKYSFRIYYCLGVYAPKLECVLF